MAQQAGCLGVSRDDLSLACTALCNPRGGADVFAGHVVEENTST